MGSRKRADMHLESRAISARVTKQIVTIFSKACDNTVHLFFLFALRSKIACTFSILHMSLENTNPRLRPIDQFKHIKPGKAFTFNLKSMIT